MAVLSDWIGFFFPKGNKQSIATYLRVVKPFEATDNRGIKNLTFDKDTIVERLDDKEEGGYIWISYCTNCTGRTFYWEGWVPLENLKSCTPGPYRVVCSGGRAKGSTITSLQRDTVLVIDKIPTSPGLWHYTEHHSRKSGTTPPSCLQWVDRGHPPSIPALMPSSSTINKRRSTGVSKQCSDTSHHVIVPQVSRPVEVAATSIVDRQSAAGPSVDGTPTPAALLPNSIGSSIILDSDGTTCFEDRKFSKISWSAHVSATDCVPPVRSNSPKVIDAAVALATRLKFQKDKESKSTDEAILLARLSRSSS